MTNETGGGYQTQGRVNACATFLLFNTDLCDLKKINLKVNCASKLNKITFLRIQNIKVFTAE